MEDEPNFLACLGIVQDRALARPEMILASQGEDILRSISAPFVPTHQV